MAAKEISVKKYRVGRRVHSVRSRRQAQARRQYGRRLHRLAMLAGEPRKILVGDGGLAQRPPQILGDRGLSAIAAQQRMRLRGEHGGPHAADRASPDVGLLRGDPPIGRCLGDNPRLLVGRGGTARQPMPAGPRAASRGRLRARPTIASSSSFQSDVLPTMVGPSKSPTTHESQKTCFGNLVPLKICQSSASTRTPHSGRLTPGGGLLEDVAHHRAGACPRLAPTRFLPSDTGAMFIYSKPSFVSFQLYLCELDNLNLGQYSSTKFRRGADISSMLAVLAESSPRSQPVTSSRRTDLRVPLTMQISICFRLIAT
jgi:hypothetical protein